MSKSACMHRTDSWLNSLRVRRRLPFLAVAACFASANVLALPLGAQVVNGTATLDRAGNVLTVSNSNGAILNWQSFNIGAGETTRFVQTSAASSVLNRVLANDPTVLLGNLTSNGKVWLVNPAGIFVGAGARIDTAAFVASTLNVTNADFIARRLKFDAAAGAGTVVNQGWITTPQGGSVYLIGSQVSNQGIITTPQGETILAAGNKIELIDSATPGVKVEITGAAGTGTNLGQITAEAGRIGIAGAIVKNSGSLNASSVVHEGGRIFLRATKQIELTETSRVGADGTAGGQITAIVSEHGQIAGALRARGEITAQGNGSPGSGGFIETSAASLDIDQISVSTRGGEWLLDPNNITIQASGSDTNVGGNPNFLSNNDSSIVTTGSIQTALNAGTSVTVSTGSGGSNAQAGDITVASAIDKTAGGNATLTLNAHNNINLNASVGSSSGQLDMLFNANSDTTGGGAVIFGTTTLNANGGGISIPGTANLSAGSTTLNSASTIGTLNVSGGTLTGTGSITVPTGGAFTWSNGVISGSGTLTTQAGVATTLAPGFAQTAALRGSRVWDNFGTVTFTPNTGTLSYFQIDDTTADGTALVNNKSGALFNLNASFNDTHVIGVGTFNNAGELRKSLNTAVATSGFAPAFNNQAGGTVNVNSGTLRFDTGGSDAGNYALSNNSTLQFHGGPRSISGNIGGTGNVTFSKPQTATAVYTLSGDYNISGTTTAALDDLGTAGDLLFNGSVSNLGSSYVQSGGITNVSFAGMTAGAATGFQNLASIVVNSGSLTFASGTSFSGLTSLTRAGSGTLDLGSNSLTVATLDLSGGTLTGSGGITVTSGGSFNWGGSLNAIFSGTGTLNTQAAVTTSITPGFARTASLRGSRVWDNYGAVTFTPNTGTLSFFEIDDTSSDGSAVLNNKGSGLFNINAAFTDTHTIGVGTFNNSGELRKSLNTSVATSGFAPVLNNQPGGVININSGSLQLNGALTQDGAIQVASGTSLVKTGGFTNSGDIQGTGTINVGAGNTLTNNGTVRPGGSGAIGTLSVTGNLANGAAGALEIELLDNSVQYDNIVATGNVSLGGTVKANDLAGYQTLSGHNYSIVTSSGGSVSGTPVFVSDTGGAYSGAGSPIYVMSATANGAAQFVWSGSSDNFWDTAANWTANHIPSSTELAVIDGVGIKTIEVRSASGTQSPKGVLFGSLGGTDHMLISGGTLAVGATGMSVPASSTLTLSGGTLSGSGPVTVGGAFNITGISAITGSGLLTTQGATTINMGTANGYVQLTGGKTWNNAGTLTVGGDDYIYFGYTSGGANVLNNVGGGTLNLSSTSAAPLNFYTGTATVNNAGTLNQTASGTHNIDNSIGFNNSGTVNVDAGTLTISGSGTDTGIYAVDAGTTLNLAGGTRNLNSGSNITGLGSLGVTGATVNVNNLLDISTSGTALNVGSGALNVNGTLSVGTLNLSGGSLGGTGNLTTTGAFNISGVATITGSGLLSTEGATTINMATVNGYVQLTGGKTWNNTGTLMVGGDDFIYFGYTGGGANVLTNAVGGTLNLASSSATPLNFYTGTATVNNAGTLNQTASGTHTIENSIGFNNSGTVNVDAGTLTVGGSGTDTGVYAVDASTTLNFSGGTRNLNAGSNVTGLGSLGVTGATVNVNNLLDISTSGTALNISGGALNVNGTLSVGTLNLSGGSLGGSGNLTTTGAFNIGDISAITGSGVLTTQGSTTVSMATANGYVQVTGGKTWNNQGTLTVGGDDYIYFGYTGGGANVLNNVSGGTLNLSSTSAAPLNFYTGTATVNNAGTLNQTLGGTHNIDNGIGFNNSGTVNVDAGMLTISGGGTDIGVYAVDAGTTLKFAGGTRNLNTGVAFSGPGILQIAGGTVSVNNPLTIAAPTLNFSGGTLSGAGNLTIAGAFNISGIGTLTGSGVLTTQGVTTIDMVTANGYLQLTGGKTWNNEGTLTVGGDDFIYFGYTSGGTNVLNNAAAGTLNLASTNATPMNFYTGVATLNNAGIVNQTTSGTHNLDVGVNNSGTLNVDAGTLAISGSGTDTGVYAVDAGTTLNFSGGTRNLNAASNITGLGSLGVTGATVNVNNLLDISTSGTALNVGSGALNINGTLSVGTLNLSGGSLGGTGNLTTTGAFNISGISTITGSGLLTTQGATTINMASANGYVQLIGGKTWNNTGTLTVGGDDYIYFGYTSGGTNILSNAVGGTLNLSSTNATPLNFYTGTATLNNAGILNQTLGGTHTVDNSIGFNNSGTVNVDAGTLAIAGGGTDTGAYAVDAGTTLNFAGGTRNLNTGVAFSGAGVLQISAGTVSVNNLLTIAAPTLTLSGGTLTGAGDLTTTGTFNISGISTVSGSGVLTTQGVTTVDMASANGYVQLTGGKTWNNAGTLTVGGDDYIYFGYTGGGINVLSNVVGGTLNLSTTHATPLNFYTGTATLNNAGTLNQTVSGTHNVANGIGFNNSGTVNVDAGALMLSGGGTQTGAYAVDPGTTLNFAGGTYNFDTGVAFSGTGILQISAGTVSVNNPLTIAAPPLNLSGGILTGAGDLTITGPFNITGISTISGSGLLTTQGITTIDMASANGYLQLTGGKTWSNSGTLTLGGDDYIYFGYTGGGINVLNNAVGGTLNLSSSNLTPLNFYTGTATLNNAGIVNQTMSGAHNVENGISFNNSGTVNVDVGTLTLSGGGTDTGAYAVDAGTTLKVAGGTRNLNTGVAFSGGGVLQIAAGTVSVNNPLTIAAPLLELAGGTLTGAGDLTISGTFNITGINTITGSGLLTTQGVTTIDMGTANGYVQLAGGKTWNNAGTLTVGGDDYIYFGYTGGGINVLNNVVGGTLNLASTQATPLNFYTGTATLNNAGTLNQTLGGTHTVAGGIALANTGTLNVGSGTLVHTGTLAQSGTLNVASGASFQRNAGFANAGIITGGGTLELGAGTLSNTGTIAPGVGAGGTATLSINGNLAQGNGGQINIDVSGPTTYDVLAVSGNANLAATGSTLNVAGAQPAGSYTVITAASITGVFSSVNSGVAATPTYNAGNVLLGLSGGISWDGGASTLNWTDANNWSGDVLPGLTDLVFVGIAGGGTVTLSSGSHSIKALSTAANTHLSINGGSLTLNDAGTASVLAGNLTLISGSLSTASPLTVNGAFDLVGGVLAGSGAVTLNGASTWTGGTLAVGGAGGVTIPGGRTLAIGGAAVKVLDGGKLNNSGTVAWSGAGNLILNNGGLLANNGLFEIQSDASFQYTAGVAPGLSNAGTLRKSGGAGVTVIGLTNPFGFSNTGILDVQVGTVQYAGNNSFNSGSAFTGAGVSQVISGGAFNGAISSANLDLAGGSYSGTAAFSGTSVWSGGTLLGANFSIPAGSTLNIANSGNVVASNAIVNNAGTINWSGAGNLVLNDGSQLANSGLFNIQTDADIQYTAGVAPSLSNTGTLQKSAGAGLTVIGLTNPFVINNSGGSLNVQTGTLELNGAVSFSGASSINGNVMVNGSGGGNSGTLTLGAGAVLDYSGGSHAFTAATNFTGAGTLTLSGATWTGSGAVSLDTVGLNWTGGALAVGGAGGVTVPGGRTLAIGGAAVKVLDGGKLNNSGSIAWSGAGNLILNNGGVLTNNGLFEIQSDASFQYTVGIAPSLINAGTLRKSGGAGVTVIGLSNPFALTNSGILDVQVGTVEKAGGFTNAGTLSGGGSFSVGAGNSLINQGTLSPGGSGTVGTLSIVGNLDLSGGSLSIDLGGTGAGQSDKLVVNGNVIIGGNLNAAVVGAYVPVNADAIVFLNMSGSAGGSFATTSVPANFSAGYNLAAGEGARLIYATAGTRTFNNSQGNLDWGTALNWTGGQPGAADAALISAGHAVTHASGSDSVGALSIASSNSLNVSGGSLTVLGATTLDGTLLVSASGAAALNGAVNGATSGQVTISGGSLNLGGTTTLASLTQSGGTLNGAGNLSVANSFSHSAGSIAMTGALAINHSGNLSLPAMTSLGSLLARASGDITLNGSIATSGAGNSLVLAAGGNFLNAGNAALSAGSNGGADRWLVYSANPTGIVKGGLSSAFRHYNASYASYAPGSVGEAGRGFIYAAAAGTLAVNTTLASGSAAHVYGNAPDATLGYALSAFADAEDNAGNIGVAGSPGFNLPSASSDAGAYGVGYVGGLSSAVGYGFAAGTPLAYNVGQAPLTITANNQSKVYGDTLVLGGTEFVATGLKNGQSVGSVTLVSSGAAATAGVAASPYAISASAAGGGSFNPANYSLTYVNGVLSVSARALTVGFAPQSKIYDGDATATIGGYTLGNVANGDTLGLVGSAAYDNRHVGAAKTVSYSGLAPSGAAAANYSLAPTATGSGAITQLSSVSWTGGASGNWSVKENWTGNALPDANNVLAVSIPAGSAVTFDTATAATTLNSLAVDSGGSFVMAGSSLTIASSLTTPGFVQSGGILSGTGSLTASQSFAKSGGTLALAGPLNINQAAGNLSFSNDAALHLGAVSTASGSIAIEANGGIFTAASPVTASGGSLLLTAHSPIVVGSGGLSATGDIALTAMTPSVSSTVTLGGALAAGGTVTIAAYGAIAQDAAIQAQNIALTSTGGNIVVASGAVSSVPPGGSIAYSATAGSIVSSPANFSGATPLLAGAGSETESSPTTTTNDIVNTVAKTTEALSDTKTDISTASLAMATAGTSLLLPGSQTTGGETGTFGAPSEAIVGAGGTASTADAASAKGEDKPEAGKDKDKDKDEKKAGSRSREEKKETRPGAKKVAQCS